MKCQKIKYNRNDIEWHIPSDIPDNPRSVLIYTEEGGVAEASYNIQTDEWIQFRWSCPIIPIAWREMPRYESKDSL